MFDPEAFGAAMGELIRAAVEPLEKRIDELQGQLKAAPDFEALVATEVEKRVAAIPVPQNGKDAPVLDRAALIKDLLAQMPQPADGKDGEPGAPGKDGRDGVDGQNGLDGKDGANGVNGSDGKDGIRGADGAKGADGLGVAGAMIDRGGALQITLTNGEVKNLGLVVGKNGEDGKDGMSLDGFELEYLPESHEISLKATAAGRVKELRYPAGGIRPGGYWREGTKTVAGEAWVHDGSTWIAKTATSSKPESRSEDWIIAARKGRDGERGAKGIDGLPPAPIKLGT